MEKLIVEQVDIALESHPLHKNQHGFQKGKSTESAISQTVNYIEKHINNGEDVLGVFFDIQAAFDTICPKHIKNSLLKHGADGDIAEWYYKYITHRNLTTTIGGHTYKITVGIRFPQGGVCSAKFWIIAFNEAIEIINTYGITGQGFADDCGPLIGGNSTHDMYKNMQRMLNKLYLWGKSKNLTFNPEKSIAILLCKKRKPQEKYLKMGGKLIKHDKQVKYLGVTLDKKLNWRLHINDKINTCKGMLTNLLNKYRHTTRSRPKLMKWIYTGVIRPKLTYACMIWGPNANTKICLLYTSPSPRDRQKSRMPSSA